MDNEQFMNQNLQSNMPKPPRTDITEEVAEGALDVGLNIGLEVIEDALEGADDLPAIAIVGIIAGIVAVVGGIIFAVYKLAKACRKK